MTKPDQPAADRYCDLVMKGGITSGVVYPKAISRLSKEYHFRSIGGTSAGAIAAALTAAAEYQRRRTGSGAGFEMLSALPDDLKEEVPGTKGRKLLSLFQAQPQTRRLFSVLIGSLNAKGTYRRIAKIIGGFLWSYWPATAVSILATAGLFWVGADWLACLLSLLILLVASIAAWVYRDLTRGVVGNGFGLCTGMTPPDAGHPALTPWLHGLIQKTAGLSETGDPLTFGMLWDVRGGPEAAQDMPPPRSIDLQMFSTNLSHGRPYIFPLTEPEPTAPPSAPKASSGSFRSSDRLFFRPDELAPYLPPEVLAWMIKYGRRYERDPTRGERDPATEEGAGFLEVPHAHEFPVILAARMSLSFPVLFSAVPLWAIDFDLLPGRRTFRKCWFSDGGISSNFPMHLFDGLVPAWPTFGIDLEPEMADRGLVFLPQKYAEGYGERWDNFNEEGNPGSRFGGFLSAILATMQNWNDNSLSRMPGVRDRIARVRLRPDEGGMNLDMDASTIDAVAGRGLQAAQDLIERFRAPDGQAATPGWDDQRFIRLSLLLKMLEARAAGVVAALDPACAHASTFDDIITLWESRAQGFPPEAPPGYERPLTAAQATTLRQVIGQLQAMSLAMTDSKNRTNFVPLPHPELRVRPPL
jgi:predicted acylesterase/phospholipase RssA